MRKKIYSLLTKAVPALVLAMVTLSSFAQNLRTVRGLVADDKGRPMAGVTLKAQGSDEQFQSDRMGRFEFKLPFSCTKLTAYKDGFPPTTVDISSSFTLIRIYPAPSVTEQTTSVQTSEPAAVQPTAPVAEQPAAQPVPEQASGAVAEPSATPEVQETQTPGQGTVSQPKEKKEKVVKEKPVKEKKEKDVRQEPDGTDKPGFAFAIDLSYLYDFGKGTVTLTNLGEQAYGALHPLEATVSLGYRFNNTFTLFAGSGFLYDLYFPFDRDSIDGDVYKGVTIRRFDVPVFAGLKASFCKGTVRPFVLAQAGIYALSVTPCFEAGAGVGFRVNGTHSINLFIGAKNALCPSFTPEKFNGYPFRIAPSVKVGYSF